MRMLHSCFYLYTPSCDWLWKKELMSQALKTKIWNSWDNLRNLKEHMKIDCRKSQIPRKFSKQRPHSNDTGWLGGLFYSLWYLGSTRGKWLQRIQQRSYQYLTDHHVDIHWYHCYQLQPSPQLSVHLHRVKAVNNKFCFKLKPVANMKHSNQ